MKRMQIVGYQHQEMVKDGLPPLPVMPPHSGLMRRKVVGRFMTTDGWDAQALCDFAKLYGRTCATALDTEIAVLKAERDALKAQLDELQQ
jgi:hypothetical protein